MPRTRTVMISHRIAVWFLIVGLLIVFPIADLINGKEALYEVIVLGGMLALGIIGSVSTRRTLKQANAKDWAMMPPEVRRDLPYGAQEKDGVIVFPTDASWVIGLAVLGAGSAALGLYGFFTEDSGRAVPVAVMMGVFAGVFFGLAWMIHGVKWTVDADGVTRSMWPKARITWDSIAEFHTDRRKMFLSITGPNRAKPKLNFSVVLLEISVQDLMSVLRKAPQDSTLKSR